MEIGQCKDSVNEELKDFWRKRNRTEEYLQESTDKSLCINDPNANIKGLEIDPDFEMIIIQLQHCFWNCATEDEIIEFWQKTSLSTFMFQQQVDFKNQTHPYQRTAKLHYQTFQTEKAHYKQFKLKQNEVVLDDNQFGFLPSEVEPYKFLSVDYTEKVYLPDNFTWIGKTSSGVELPFLQVQIHLSDEIT